MSTPASVLSDGTILRLVEEGRILIDPWEPRLVQPASVDLRLGDSFRVFHNHRASAIDLRQPPENLTEEVVVPPGESFVIHPGEFCLGRTLEWVELPDDIVARIEGKALALDTPVPTPGGAMTTMGELEPGDWVLGGEGLPTPVVAVSEVMHGRPCREVEFADGTVVVADVDHLWRTSTPLDPRPRIATTQQIEATLERESAGAVDLVCITHDTDIVAVRETDSVPVRCIEVGAADGMYLVTEARIPTHNSSLGRLGLIVHATAGFCDPGWKGTLTLELNNLTRVPIKLYPELEIAQLSFMALDRPAQRPYGSPELGSHYQGQRAATASRYRSPPGEDRIG